jgi:hypothetical protein
MTENMYKLVIAPSVRSLSRLLSFSVLFSFSWYHQQCDRIKNMNPFAYEKVVRAAAYAIEYVGRLNDLEKWLYP